MKKRNPDFHELSKIWMSNQIMLSDLGLLVIIPWRWCSPVWALKSISAGCLSSQEEMWLTGLKCSTVLTSKTQIKAYVLQQWLILGVYFIGTVYLSEFSQAQWNCQTVCFPYFNVNAQNQEEDSAMNHKTKKMDERQWTKIDFQPMRLCTFHVYFTVCIWELSSDSKLHTFVLEMAWTTLSTSRLKWSPVHTCVVQLTMAELLDLGLTRSHPRFNAPLGRLAH